MWCQIYCLPTTCKHWMARSCCNPLLCLTTAMHFLQQSILFAYNLAVLWMLYFRPSTFVTVSVYICYFVSVRQSLWRLLHSFTPIFYSEPPMFGFCITVSVCNSTEIMCGFAKSLQYNPHAYSWKGPWLFVMSLYTFVENKAYRSYEQ